MPKYCEDNLKRVWGILHEGRVVAVASEMECEDYIPLFLDADASLTLQAHILDLEARIKRQGDAIEVKNEGLEAALKVLQAARGSEPFKGTLDFYEPIIRAGLARQVDIEDVVPTDETAKKEV